MTVGVTLAVPGVTQGLQTLFPAPSVTVKAVGVPPVTCQVSVAVCPDVMVLGEAVKLTESGTLTVTVCGPAVPLGPVAVMEYVVV